MIVSLVEFFCKTNFNSMFTISVISIVLQDTSCLQRYTYHRSLVGWYIGGLPKDIIFTHYQLESCLIIIGGIITEKEKRKLFGETALSERLYVADLLKGYNKTFKLINTVNIVLKAYFEQNLDRITTSYARCTLAKQFTRNAERFTPNAAHFAENDINCFSHETIC